MRKLAWSQRPSKAEERRRDKGRIRRKEQRRLKREVRKLRRLGATEAKQERLSVEAEAFASLGSRQ